MERTASLTRRITPASIASISARHRPFRNAGDRSSGHEDSRMTIGYRRVVLIGRRCIEHDNSAAVARLFEELHDRPRRRDGVTRTHRREKPGAMLEICDRRAVEI